MNDPKDHSLKLPEDEVSTDPSRSATPQPRVCKPKHKVIAVSDSSEEERDTASGAAAAAKHGPDDKMKKKSDGANEDAGRAAAPADAPSAPPKLPAHKETGMSFEIATWGQMILDGKSGTIPTMWKLKHLKDIQRFRLAWEKYVDEVETYNLSHAIQIKANPVILYVDSALWRSIS